MNKKDYFCWELHLKNKIKNITELVLKDYQLEEMKFPNKYDKQPKKWNKGTFYLFSWSMFFDSCYCTHGATNKGLLVSLYLVFATSAYIFVPPFTQSRQNSRNLTAKKKKRIRSAQWEYRVFKPFLPFLTK